MVEVVLIVQVAIQSSQRTTAIGLAEEVVTDLNARRKLAELYIHHQSKQALHHRNQQVTPLASHRLDHHSKLYGAAKEQGCPLDMTNQEELREAGPIHVKLIEEGTPLLLDKLMIINCISRTILTRFWTAMILGMEKVIIVVGTKKMVEEEEQDGINSEVNGIQVRDV